MSAVPSSGKAFTGDDAKKSKATILYERNTHKKQLKTTRVERDSAEEMLGLVQAHYIKALRHLHTVAPSEDTEDAIWAYYALFTTTQQVFTRDTTGEKTHKGKATVRRKGGVEEEIDAHLLPSKEYYKPWKDGDVPAFFLKITTVSAKNFTLDADANLVPIKKY